MRDDGKASDGRRKLGWGKGLVAKAPTTPGIDEPSTPAVGTGEAAEEMPLAVTPSAVAGAVDAHGANKKAIDVVVARPGAGHLRTTLRPAQWSGVGLIGAKITAVVTDDELRKTKPQPVGSKLEAALKRLESVG
jgi:hypothetical protein